MNGKWVIIAVKGIFAVSVVSDQLGLMDKSHIQYKQMYYHSLLRKIGI